MGVGEVGCKAEMAATFVDVLYVCVGSSFQTFDLVSKANFLIMFNDIRPKYSKKRINKAGERIRARNPELEDYQAVEHWRASHSHILNTFQATLRGRARGRDITVAQRLKRRHTIFDKLMRQPRMQLSRMNDVAGCRLIFSSQDELFAFRNSLHKARFKHVLRNGGDDRYNYIENPKESGYRGVHDVYQYQGATALGSQWDGLLLEIQYRTTFQHAWATAVEVADFIDTTRIKFGDTDRAHLRFFQLASELIARNFEGQTSCCSELSDRELVKEFNSVERRIRLLGTFKGLQAKGNELRSTENAILIFHAAGPEEPQKLEVLTFPSMSSAITRYAELESQYADADADIVLVRAGSSEGIRDAFRNYFSDVNEFVRLVTRSLEQLEQGSELR